MKVVCSKSKKQVLQYRILTYAALHFGHFRLLASYRFLTQSIQNTWKHLVKTVFLSFVLQLGQAKDS
jgi:hypothetical protein